MSSDIFISILLAELRAFLDSLFIMQFIARGNLDESISLSWCVSFRGGNIQKRLPRNERWEGPLSSIPIFKGSPLPLHVDNENPSRADRLWVFVFFYLSLRLSWHECIHRRSAIFVLLSLRPIGDIFISATNVCFCEEWPEFIIYFFYFIYKNLIKEKDVCVCVCVCVT